MRKTNLFLSSMLATSMVATLSTTQVCAAPSYPLGVTVEANTNPAWDADYVATFAFQDEDAKDAVKVNVKGGFQFYKESETTSYQAFGDNSGIPCYDAYEYEDGMYAASSNVQTGDMDSYQMSEIGDDLFELTMPLPANQYFYAYYIEYSDGTTADRVIDPANIPEKNVDSDAGWSLFYVGNGETAGQEYIYPSSCAQGNVEYVPYSAIDGTTQYLGVYTPAGYDPAKTYKTIYVSHGGGGNEVEWMTIGSVPNIMDNLIGAGEVAEAIVVTMDNQYFGWDYDLTLPNVLDYVIPKIEADYSVSHEAADRAFCGLSMGSMTTNEMMKRNPGEFGYFGAFSGGNSDLDPANFDGAALNEASLYFTAGTVDIAYNNTMGISTLDYLGALDDLGVNYDFDLKLGGHDWYVWRDSLTTFVKDYLWNKDIPAATKNDDQAGAQMNDPAKQETVQTTTQAAQTTQSGIIETADGAMVGLYLAGLVLGLGGLYLTVKKAKA